MECPSCRYPVPAEWSMCRRCGAPLPHDVEDSRVAIPPGLARRRSATGLATRSPDAPASTSTAAAAAVVSSPPDTLLPGALPHAAGPTPRATASNPAAPRKITPAPVGTLPQTITRAAGVARRNWRRALVLAIVAFALVTSLVAAWPVVFHADNSPATSSTAGEARAVGLLRTVVEGGRTLFAPRHSFARVTPSALRASAHEVPIVSSTTAARVGQVSMRVTSAAVLTLATPADARRCVFARDEPGKSVTRFVTTRTSTCRAAAAPAKGWRTR